MSRLNGSRPPGDLRWAIYIAPAAATSAIPDLREAGTPSRFHTDVRDVVDAGDLVAMVSREFRVPHRIRGLDAVLSTLSDLEWVPNEAGYVWILKGLGPLSLREPVLVTKLVALLVHLCDRWRSGGISFRILIEADAALREDLKAEISRAYRAMRESPWGGNFEETPILESDGIAWHDVSPPP